MAGAIYTLIGSSLAGSAVQGAVAAEAAAEYCRGVEMPEISKAKMNEVQEDILAPLKREAGYSPAWVTQTLQGIMIPNFIIYIKKESLLNLFKSLLSPLMARLPLAIVAFDTKNWFIHGSLTHFSRPW